MSETTGKAESEASDATNDATNEERAADGSPDAPAGAGEEPGSETQGEGERREYGRVPLSTDISLVSESNIYAGITCDISEGGIFVATYQLLPRGTAVDLQVSFEAVGGPQLSVPAEVRWVREGQPGTGLTPGMGLSFLELPSSHREWITGFVSQRDPLLFEDTSTEAPLGGGRSQDEAAERDIDLLGTPSRAWIIGLSVIVVGLLGVLGYLMFSGSGAEPPSLGTRPTGGSLRAPQDEPDDQQPAPAAVALEVAADAAISADVAISAALDGATGSVARVADAGTLPDATSDRDAAPLDATSDRDAARPDEAVAAAAASEKPSAGELAAGQPAHVQAGHQLAGVLRPCLPKGAVAAALKVALYTQTTGKVVRGFISGVVDGAKIQSKATRCVQAAMRGLQLPLKPRKTTFVQWRVTLKDAALTATLTGPRYLRK